MVRRTLLGHKDANYEHNLYSLSLEGEVERPLKSPGPSNDLLLGKSVKR
jgi:hypothetical protein